MTAQESYIGRHRPDTVPSNWGRPGERRHLVGTPGFDWTADGLPTLPPYELPPPRRPAWPPPGELPADGWSEAMVPGLDATGSFSLEEVAVAEGRLPERLTGPDPVGTGPIPLWGTQPLPVVAEPRNDRAPTLTAALLIGLYLIFALGTALLALAVVPPI